MAEIKVLHVYKTCFPYTQGGIEEVIRQLTIETTKLGVNNRVVCLSLKCKTKEVLQIEGAEVHCYPLLFEIASCGFSLQLFKDFKQHTQWADIIHYQTPWPFADMLHVLNRIKTPSIITYQSDIVRQKYLLQVYKPLMHCFLRQVQAIIASSENYLNSSPVLKKYKAKTTVIPNGIAHIPEKYSQLEKNKVQKELVKKVGDDFFFFMGVLRYYKGLSYLLTALKEVDYVVVIAGAGPEELKLKKQVDELGLRKVVFLGFISELEKEILYKLSKAVIFPSCERTEAYGITLVEAAMHKRAMVSTELKTGTSFINNNGETGFVVEPKNAEQLKIAMDKLYKNEELTKQMGLAAYQRYQKLLTSQLMAEAYVKLYSRVIGTN